MWTHSTVAYLGGINMSLCQFSHVAGRSVTEEKLDEMLESDDPQIFTQDVSTIVIYHMYCSTCYY